MTDWDTVDLLCHRLAASPKWDDVDAATLAWLEAARHTREAVTTVLLDERPTVFSESTAFDLRAK
ncbi:3-methyladenine DNA glycosylase AlkD [Halarchaeum solikamskense]|uniref:hypothetical protein n=1 Tax=Halarchaeum nitratireducens TaxID=489913 RepID=UPI001B3B1642|nr:hypothetical protein [Halarchaeum solikamskense]MBP2250769.1 3-methyladenine DNA glycosylase AlkD [Halarchaeum solikamskense]